MGNRFIRQSKEIQGETEIIFAQRLCQPYVHGRPLPPFQICKAVDARLSLPSSGLEGFEQFFPRLNATMSEEGSRISRDRSTMSRLPPALSLIVSLNDSRDCEIELETLSTSPLGRPRSKTKDGAQKKTPARSAGVQCLKRGQLNQSCDRIYPSCMRKRYRGCLCRRRTRSSGGSRTSSYGVDSPLCRISPSRARAL